MGSNFPVLGGAIGNADVVIHAPSLRTYRIQFNLNFRFVDAEELVPYLHALGVTHLYASPRFRARKGSLHGYDGRRRGAREF